MEKILNRVENEYWEKMLQVYDEPPEGISAENKIRFINVKMYRARIAELDELISEQSETKKSASGDKTQLVWMTISKKTDRDDEQFIKEVQSLANYKPYNNRLAYCFEATDIRNDKFHNVHAHLLFVKQKGYNKQKYLNYTTKKVDNFNINFKTYPLSYYNDKLDYINGIKIDEQGEKPEVTHSFRTKYNL